MLSKLLIRPLSKEDIPYILSYPDYLGDKDRLERHFGFVGVNIECFDDNKKPILILLSYLCEEGIFIEFMWRENLHRRKAYLIFEELSKNIKGDVYYQTQKQVLFQNHTVYDNEKKCYRFIKR